MKKVIIILLINLILFVGLFFIQNDLFNKLIENYSDSQNDKNIILHVMIMKMNGEFINWILGLTFMNLILNVLIFKYWIKSKKWILKPILITVVTLIISTYFIKIRASNLNMRLTHTANTGYNSLWHYNKKENKNYI